MASRIFSAGLALGLASSAPAAWYWPFGYDEDSTNAPPRLHRLLEKANDYIELAEDESANGNGDKAIENYKLALAELRRVEQEHPDRAESTEFAPLRNRRAACTAAIDTIRFAQINENERAVAVSDTTELQKKWNRKHGIDVPDEGEAGTDGKKGQEGASGEKEKAEAKGVKDEPKPSVSFETRMKMALDELRQRNYAPAVSILRDLQKERAEDLDLLLLLAAAQSGAGSNFAARRTLEKAIKLHPKAYQPYYNLAFLSLKLGENAETAREYYEIGREEGQGPRNAELERRLDAKEGK
ncbi:MAG: hypothetical protein ACI4Q3_10985 [Kiritimatiellia bacterium]